MKDVLAQILNELTDPVLVIDSQPRVLYANPSAQQIGLDLAGHPLLREVMKMLPLSGQSISVELSDMRARIVQWGHIYMVVAHQLVPQNEGLLVEAFLNMLGTTVLEPLNRFVAQLEVFCQEAENLPVEWEILQSRGGTLARTLGDLRHLLQLRGGAGCSMQDRVDLPALVVQILQKQESDYPGRRFNLVDEDGPIGAVYANRDWLAYALQSSLNQLAASSVSGDQIEVQLKQQGLFVSVRLRNLGRTKASSRTWIETRATPERQPINDPMLLSVEIANQILMLHKGHFSIQDHGSGSEIFMDLPTGAPPEVPSESLAEQMERYATDLARLFASRNKMARAHDPAIDHHSPIH